MKEKHKVTQKRSYRVDTRDEDDPFDRVMEFSVLISSDLPVNLLSIFTLEDLTLYSEQGKRENELQDYITRKSLEFIKGDYTPDEVDTDLEINEDLLHMYRDKKNSFDTDESYPLANITFTDYREQVLTIIRAIIYKYNIALENVSSCKDTTVSVSGRHKLISAALLSECTLIYTFLLY